MSVSQSFREWVLEQLRPGVPRLRDRGMFGGVGLYSGELFFALLFEDRLYLKVDDGNRADFTAAGMGPFQPYGDDRMTMQYYEAPLEVIEHRDRLAAWTGKAIEVASRAKQARPKRKRVKAARTQSKFKSESKSR